MPTEYPDLQNRLIVLMDGAKLTRGWRMDGAYGRNLIPHVTKLAINGYVNAPSQFAGIAALDGPDDSSPHDGKI